MSLEGSSSAQDLYSLAEKSDDNFDDSLSQIDAKSTLSHLTTVVTEKDELENIIFEEIRAEQAINQRHINLFNDLGVNVLRQDPNFSVYIPSILRNGPNLIRKYFLTTEQFSHLLDELNGEVYGPPERPEFELLTIGQGAKIPNEFDTITESDSRQIIHDMSNGQGVQLFFDPIRVIFVLSEKVEDELILLYLNDPEKALEISMCQTKFGPHHFAIIDLYRRRLWRRFMKLEIVPLLSNVNRMSRLIKRYSKHLDEQKYGVDTDSSESSEEEAVQVMKKKKKKKRVVRNKRR